MASEWIDDEGAYQEALDGSPGEGDAEDIRYGLTPLGALALDEGGAFSGFGPCAVADAFAGAAENTRQRRAPGRRTRRPTPLFG